MSKGVALVIGAGDATGGAVAKRFAAGGYTAAITRRPRHMDKLEALAEEIRAAGGEAVPFGVDARDEDDTEGLFEEIERELRAATTAAGAPWSGAGAGARFARGSRGASSECWVWSSTRRWGMRCS